MLKRTDSFANVKTKGMKSKRPAFDDMAVGGGGGGGGGDEGPSVASSGSLGRKEAAAKRPPRASTNRIQSLFSPFNKSQDRLEQLTGLLHGFTVHGSPRIPDMYTRGRPHYDRRAFVLEDNWTDIVSKHLALTKTQKDQQEAIWELLTTEVEYIHKLKVIIDLFFCCLVNLQCEEILTEIENKKVFSNIVEIYYATCHFWVNHLSQVLRVARETREPLNPSLLKSGFLVFEKIFEPYTKYCLEQESCLEYIKARIRDNDSFRTFILWGETQKQCNRLKLVDLVVKPWQRLTKYKLLLDAMKRPLEKMNKSPLAISNQNQLEQIKDISDTVEHVERFVNYVNTTMRKRHDCLQLTNMIERIETYDALDSLSDECDQLVSEFCRMDSVLNCPIPGCSQQEPRIVLLEGNLRLKDANTKLDAYCFLLTDLLLITKQNAKRGDKMRVIKPPMRLDRIVVFSLRDASSFLLLYLNEYQMAQSAFTFHGDSKLWLDNITKAQMEYKEKRSLHLTQSESLILDMYDDGDDDYASPSSDRPSSAEPRVSNEPCPKKSATLQRSLSFANLLNQDEQSSGGGGGGGCRPTRLEPLTTNQKRSKSQNFLPAAAGPCSFSRLDEETDPGGGGGRTEDTDPAAAAAAAAKSNYLGIPRALATVTGLFREVSSSSPVDDHSPRTMPQTPEADCHQQKSRFNQRRLMRSERRYHTADTIQDLKSTKAPISSLHKHRSWSCAGDARAAASSAQSTAAGSPQSLPPSWPPSTTSSDSVQSVFSSSGVSSSGSSIRMSCDSEICEETENELLEDQGDEEAPEDEEGDGEESEMEEASTAVAVEAEELPAKVISCSSVGTQTPPDVSDLAYRLHWSNPCSLLWRPSFSRSAPNISDAASSGRSAGAGGDGRAFGKFGRIRRRQMSPLYKRYPSRQPPPPPLTPTDFTSEV